jgi:hypothetical protein
METKQVPAKQPTAEEYLTNFIDSLYKFTFDAYRYTKLSELKECLKVFSSLDMNVVFPHLSMLLDQHKDAIDTGNGMDLELEFLPKIVLSDIGKKCTPVQKNKLATHLQIILANNLMTRHAILCPDEFNPFTGVTGGGLDVATINQSPMDLPESLKPKDTGGIMSHLTSMINMGELRETLKKMDPEQIRKAMDGFNSILRKDIDKDTADTITNTVVDMGEAMKNIDFEKDGFGGLMKTMNERVQNNFKDKKVDKEGIKKGFDRLMSSIVSADGTPMFDPEQPMNPFAMLSKIAMMSPEDQKKMAENCSKSMGIDLSAFEKK